MKHQHHRVEQLPKEQVNELFARRCFHGEKCTVAFVELAAGCVVPRHQHENEQFSYGISGELRFTIEGEVVTLRAGELLEIPSNVPHEAVATEDFTGIDVFSPLRADWRDRMDDYLRRRPEGSR
jgi:quercetin dioxygenase-like cupin family protein